VTSFDRACSILESALAGTARQEIVADVSRSKDFGKALRRLRDGMRSHVWQAGGHEFDSATIVRKYDSQTRQEGFHVLHDWDGKADTVNPDIIPVDVLNYVLEKRGDEPTDQAALAILLDYYFLYVLSLLSVRVWNDGDADQNLDRLNQLVQHLQGSYGSGQQFVENAETLILIATCHYELNEHGYDRLLERVKTLNTAHQTKVALIHAGCLGSHLRFGFEATYGRDTVNMRNDNVADYPWLSFALAALMREYSRLRGEGIEGAPIEAIVEGLLNGLTPDARAFVGDHPPASLSGCEAERSQFSELFRAHRQELIDAFERHRPSDQAYSPISFFFNFSHNVLKGTIVDALLRGRPWSLTLNDLLAGSPLQDPNGAIKQALAETLMGHARASPDRIRGRLMPVIVYDPRSGRRAFAVAMRKIRE
jgi:hypothetical protein